MNEWDIQKQLTKYWRKNDLVFNESVYSLVCWELMFPSWSINDNKRKWNEPSIDFVFYNEEKKEFLIVELKNEIKDNKSLLSAYCQVQHRSSKFIEGYSISQISKARKECFDFATDERGGKENDIEKINFSKDPKIAKVIMAVHFPINAPEKIEYWNKISLKDVKIETDKYQKSKEFERFKCVKKEDYDFSSNRNVELFDIGSFFINRLTSIIVIRISTIICKPFIREEDITSLFVYLRQILEEQSLKRDYSKILFFSNWILHNELSQTRTTTEIINELKQVIIKHYRDKTKISFELSKLIDLPKLKEEIIGLCERIGIKEVNPSSFILKWKNIEILILKLLLYKPVRLEEAQPATDNSDAPIIPKGFQLIEFQKSICFEILFSEGERINTRIVIQLTRI